MLQRLWNAVRHLSGDHLAASSLATRSIHPRTMQSTLSALHDIGYLLPGSLGQPTRLLYQELTRRNTLVWRAA